MAINSAVSFNQLKKSVFNMKKYVDDSKSTSLVLEDPIIVATQEEMQDMYDNNKYYSLLNRTLGLVEGESYLIEYNNKRWLTNVVVSDNIPKLIFKYQSIIIYDKANLESNSKITSTTNDTCVLNLGFKKTPREIKIYKIKELKKIDNSLLPDNLDIVNSISLGRDIDSIIGEHSTALGATTIASGMNSHAIGLSTKAIGHNSHAEGTQTQAIGVASHAEGALTIANNMGSHAEGYKTKASSNHQHVQGKYNIEDTENKYAHIVGNGTGEDVRRNAHTLDWDGNAWYAGKLSQEGTPTDPRDLTNKKYVDEKVAGIVNSAPETLDTLQELATALGNDPNFATTVTTQIGNKVDKVDGKTLTDNNLTNELKANYDAAYAYSQATHSYNDLSDKPVIPSIDGLATQEYVDAKTSLENVIYEGNGATDDPLIIFDYWTHCPLSNGNACWVIDKEVIIGENIENPYYIEMDGVVYSPKNSTYDAINNAWIYNDTKLNSGQKLYMCATYENQNKMVIPWDEMNNYSRLKVYTKTELAEAMFSGDYNDLSNKPTIPSIEGLATEEYVNDIDIKNKADIDNLFRGTDYPDYGTKILAKGKIKDIFYSDSSGDRYAMNVNYSSLNLNYLKDSLCCLYYKIKFTDSTNNVHRYIKRTFPLNGLYGYSTIEDSSLNEKIQIKCRCTVDKEVSSTDINNTSESTGVALIELSVSNTTEYTGNTNIIENGEIEIYTKYLNFLPTYGLRKFTPTTDNQPATKGYVDEVIPHTKSEDVVYTVNDLTTTEKQSIVDNGYCVKSFPLSYTLSDPEGNRKYCIRCNGIDIPMIYYDGSFICETENLKIIINQSSVAPLAQEPVDEEIEHTHYMYITKFNLKTYKTPLFTIVGKNNDCLKNEFLEKDIITETLVARKLIQYDIPSEENDVINKSYFDDKISEMVIPTKTSQLTNDSNFLTEHQSLTGLATEEYVNNKVTDTATSLTNDPDIFLTKDKYQYVTGVNTVDNIIWLPSTDLPAFLKIHLYATNCKMQCAFDTLIKWKSGQNPTDGKFKIVTDNIYEFILTYVNGSWIGEVVTYSNTEYTPTNDTDITTKKYVDDLTVQATDDETNTMLTEVLGGDYSGNN